MRRFCLSLLLSLLFLGQAHALAMNREVVDAMVTPQGELIITCKDGMKVRVLGVTIPLYITTDAGEEIELATDAINDVFGFVYDMKPHCFVVTDGRPEPDSEGLVPALAYIAYPGESPQGVDFANAAGISTSIVESGWGIARYDARLSPGALRDLVKAESYAVEMGTHGARRSATKAFNALLAERGPLPVPEE